MINIDISIGDQILVGRFKNKKIEVKDIGVDKHGGPTINGRSILKIRKMKSPNERREAVNKILDTMKKKSLGKAPIRESIERDEVHAETKKELNFDSELPKDMATVIEKWRNYIEPMKLRFQEIFET